MASMLLPKGRGRVTDATLDMASFLLLSTWYILITPRNISERKGTVNPSLTWYILISPRNVTKGKGTVNPSLSVEPDFELSGDRNDGDGHENPVGGVDEVGQGAKPDQQRTPGGR